MSSEPTDNAASTSNALEQPRPYSFFGACLVAWDRAAAVVSIACHTASARLRLALLGCKCGSRLCVDGKLILRAPRSGSIQIGSGVTFKSRFRSNFVGLTQASVLQCLRHGRISIGDNSGMSGVIISSRTAVSIGRHATIGGNVRIYDHDWHSTDPMVRRTPEQDRDASRTAPVIIGDDVFIGVNSIILKGVTIGSRSVIAAGSVVSLKSIPEDSLVAGNPAQFVRSLKKTS